MKHPFGDAAIVRRLRAADEGGGVPKPTGSDIAWLVSTESRTSLTHCIGWVDRQGSRQTEWFVKAGPFTGRVRFYFRIPLQASNHLFASLVLDKLPIRRMCVNTEHGEFKDITHLHRRNRPEEDMVTYVDERLPQPVPPVGTVPPDAYREALVGFAHHCHLDLSNFEWLDPWPEEAA